MILLYCSPNKYLYYINLIILYYARQVKLKISYKRGYVKEKRRKEKDTTYLKVLFPK